MRRGKERAYVAMNYSMLTAIYNILRDRMFFKDLGVSYYNQDNISH